MFCDCLFYKKLVNFPFQKENLSIFLQIFLEIGIISGYNNKKCPLFLPLTDHGPGGYNLWKTAPLKLCPGTAMFP